MGFRDYVAFLPDEYRDRDVIEPESTWWAWRDMNVHVARARADESPVRLLALHGGGGHSALVWPLAGLAAADGVDVAAIDLPLFGRTEVRRRGRVRYADWVDLVCDFVAAEDDGRPLVVFGASMGGMLGYETAARTGLVRSLAATCLLDPDDPEARRAASRFPLMGRSAPRILRSLAAVAGDVSVPVSWFADARSMSRDADLTKLCLRDPLGAGTTVPVGWLSSYMNFDHTAPESFGSTPVTLVHPALDDWTPVHISRRFLDRIAAPTDVVMLENCGHFPIEMPGVSQLEAELRRLCAD